MEMVRCGPLPPHLYRDYLHPALSEGGYQVQAAWQKKTELRGICHLLQGAILLLTPGINILALRVFAAFGLTIQQSFEKAVKEGDEKKVQAFLGSGVDPNIKDINGVPLVFYAQDIKIVRLLKESGAKTFDIGLLEHLIQNKQFDLAEQVVMEGLDQIDSLLTNTYYDKIKSDKEARTFLVRMGYRLSKAQAGLNFNNKTGLTLEECIFNGNALGIQTFAKAKGYKKFKEELNEVLQASPRLQTGWVWKLVLEAYIQNPRPDFEVVEEILRMDPSAQLAQDLLDILFQYDVDTTVHLCECGLIDPEEYLKSTSFSSAIPDKACFLLRIGYSATAEDLRRKRIFLEANSLEKAIFVGSENHIKNLVRRTSLEVLIPDVEKVQGRNPLFKMGWVWQTILKEYYFIKQPGQYEDHFLDLLKKVKPTVLYNPIQMLGDDTEFMQMLVSGGKEKLALNIVKKGFYVLKESYSDSVPRLFAWFLVRAGYPKRIEGTRFEEFRSVSSEQMLEKALVTGNIDLFVRITSQMSLRRVITGYRQLQNEFPYLNTLWAWKHLAENEYFAKGQYDSFLMLIQEGLFTPDAAFFNKHVPKKPVISENLKIKALVFAGYHGGPLFKRASEQGVGTFEDAVLYQDKALVQSIAREGGFQEVYELYLEYKEKYPLVDLRWMWDALFTVNPRHFEAFKKVQKKMEVPPPPTKYPLTDLLIYFDKIDFSFIPSGGIRDTLEGIIHTKKTLRENVEYVIRSIGRKRSLYHISSAEKERFECHLRWMIHYLKEDFNRGGRISKYRGQVFAKMFIDCGKCHSRWNEVFDVTRRALGGIEFNVEGIEGNLQKLLGNLRAHLIERLSRDPAEIQKAPNFAEHVMDYNRVYRRQDPGGFPRFWSNEQVARDTVHGDNATSSHARDNLIYNLRESRGLPFDRVDSPLRGATYNLYRSVADSTFAFDRLYTPGEMMEAIYAEIQANNELFYNPLVEQIQREQGPLWHKQDRGLRERVEQIGMDHKPTLKQIRELGIQGVEVESFSLDVFLEDLKKWGLSLPEIELYEEAEKAEQSEISQAFLTKWKKKIPGYDNALNKHMLYFQIRSKIPSGTPLRDELEKEYRQSPSPKDVLIRISEHFALEEDMTLGAFYLRHPEVPEELRKTALEGEEMKRHLIEVAYQLRYERAPKPLGEYLIDTEIGIFSSTVTPGNLKGGFTLKGRIHPLVLGKYLTDHGYLTPRVSGLFNQVFTKEGAYSGIDSKDGDQHVTLFKVLMALSAAYLIRKWFKSTGTGSYKWFHDKIYGEVPPPAEPQKV